MNERVGTPWLGVPLFWLVGASAGAQRDSVHADTSRTTLATPARLAPVVVAGRLTRLGVGAAARVDVAGPGTRTAAQVPVGGPAPAASLIARLPGISSFDDQGTRAQPTLDVRGFTLSPVVGVGQGVSVFLDGVRVNEADAQQVNFDLLPVEAVRDAALVRGPSALYGKNTLGGALLLTTRRGGDGGPAFDGGVDAGAFGQRGVRLSAAGTTAIAGGAALDGYALVRTGREDGWRDATAARRQLAFATVGRRAATGDVALSMLVARDSLGQAGSLPESWLTAGNHATRRANYTPGDWFAPTTVHVALRGRQQYGNPNGPSGVPGEVRGTLFVRDTRSGQFNVNAGAPSTLARVTAASVGATVEGERRTRLFGVPLVATVGGEFSRDAVRYRVFERAVAGTDIAAQPDAACTPATAVGDAAACEDATANALNAAAFAQGVLAPARAVSLVASVRGDWVRVPFVDRQTPGNSGTSAFRQLSPRVGVTVTPGAAWRGYASAGAGFRAPAAVELACADPGSPCPLPFSLGDDPPLRPVRVRNVEIGTDWTPSLIFAVTASAFRADVRDEVLLVASERTAGYFTNFPRTRRAGIELSGQAGPVRGVSGFASWAVVRSTYDADGLLASARATPDSVHPGDPLPLSPRQRATAGVRGARLVSHVLLGAELSGSAVGAQRMRGDEGGAGVPLPGYALAALHLSAGRGRVVADLSVSNLFDRRYVTFGTWAPNAFAPDRQPLAGAERVERFLTPGYPRAVALGVTVAR